MALTSEDLQTISALLDTKLDPTKKQLEQINETANRTYDANMTYRNDLEELRSVVEIFARQTVQNTTDLRNLAETQ